MVQAPAGAAILGLGVDLVEVARFSAEEARHGPDYLTAVLRPAEIERSRREAHPHAAHARHFAAKEAFLKALGGGFRGRLSWHDLEVHAVSGAEPALILHGEAARLAAEKGIAHIQLTLTATDEHVAALVIVSGREAPAAAAGP